VESVLEVELGGCAAVEGKRGEAVDVAGRNGGVVEVFECFVGGDGVDFGLSGGAGEEGEEGGGG
jgi:hypothetical protein